MQVTDEHVHDGKVLPILVDDLVKSNEWKLDKLLADGAYDSNDIFRCLSENGTPCIKVRKDAMVRKTSHNLRNLSVISQRHNLQRWKEDSVSYGHRWMVETVFSSFCIALSVTCILYLQDTKEE